MATDNKSWTELLGAFDLIGQPRTWKRFSEKVIRQLRTGELSFDWVNLGTSGVTIGAFQDVTTRAGLASPRTGHIGDWKPVEELRAGPLDYNAAICHAGRYGKPLIFDLTQTDCDVTNNGDVIYRPSCVFERAHVRRLNLVHWKDGRLEALDERSAHFVPFVMVRDQDKVTSLSRYHAERNARVDLECRYWSSTVCSARELVHALLTSIFGLVVRTPDAGRLLRLVIDRVSDRTGRVTRDFEFGIGSNGAFEIGQVKYADASSLASACLIPFRAACADDWWMLNARDVKDTIPILSNLTTMCLYAILNTHSVDPSLNSHHEVIVHPHWGAIGMAGLPPVRKGYVSSQVGYLRAVADVFARALPMVGLHAHAFLLLLAPAAIFLLTTTTGEPEDAVPINDLLERLLEKETSLDLDNFGFPEVQAIVARWWSDYGATLSPYWKGRFQTRRTLGGASMVTRTASAVIPPTFDRVSFRALCMAVSAIDGIFGNKL